MRLSKEKRFEKIFTEYKNTVFAISLMYLKDYQLAEDASQETFIKVLKKLNSLKDDEKAKSWITSIAINVCRDKLRKSLKHEIPSEELLTHASKQADEDVRLTVSEAIGKLSPELREVVILYYYQGFNQNEISKLLKIPITTIAYRLRTAKAQLKIYLKEDYDE